MRNAVTAVVASLASGQWGLITTAQASAAGISRMQLTRMVEAGLLDRVIHGVYATPGVQGDRRLTLRAAWLALDPGRSAEERMADLPAAGVVSHASAAQLLGLGDLVADEHEFTVTHRRQSTRAGVKVRRGDLEPGDVTIADGLPVTTAARTISDLLLVGHELGHVAVVVADAWRRDLVDGPALEAALAPAARRHDARDGAELLVRLLNLVGMGVEDLERDVLNNDLGRELVRKAAGAQSLDVLPAMVAALEMLAETVRAAMESSGMQVAAEAAARLADSPGMRAALNTAAQAQRLYDSPGMRAALEAAAQVQQVADSPAARALTQLAQRSAEVARLVDPDQLRAITEAISRVSSSASLARAIDHDVADRREPLTLPSKVDRGRA